MNSLWLVSCHIVHRERSVVALETDWRRWCAVGVPIIGCLLCLAHWVLLVLSELLGDVVSMRTSSEAGQSIFVS